MDQAHDPRDGPLRQRTTTDPFTLAIFILFLIIYAAIGVYVHIHGAPSRLLAPMDSNGRNCGVDPEVVNKSYLLFFDLSKCHVAKTSTNSNKVDEKSIDCPTTQICVTSCPNATFHYQRSRSYRKWPPQELLEKMLCRDKVTLSGITWRQLDKLVDDELCAKWYVESRSIVNRCLPHPNATYPREVREIQNVKKMVSIIEQMSPVEKFFYEALEDIKRAKFILLGSVPFSIVASVIFILILKSFAIEFTVLSFAAMWAFVVYVLYHSFRSLIGDANEYALDGFNVGFIIGMIISVMILTAVIFFLRKKLKLACQLLQEASRAVTKVWASLIVPLIPMILQFGFLAYALSLFLHTQSIEFKTYKITRQIVTNCKCSDNVTLVQNASCDPLVFHNECSENNGPCFTSSCRFVKLEKSSHIVAIHIVNVVGFLWTRGFADALEEMILATVFATWYWTLNKRDVKNFSTVFTGTYLVLRYHLGTVALGSLIMAILNGIRLVIENVRSNAESLCFNCFVKCGIMEVFERFIRYISRNAYVTCAIFGNSLVKSAKSAFDLIIRNLIQAYVLTRVANFILFVSKLLVSVLSVFSALGFTEFVVDLDKEFHHKWLIIGAIVGLSSFIVSHVMMSVQDFAIDTMFLCFLIDTERNDGSRQRPYYMSKRLWDLWRPQQ